MEINPDDVPELIESLLDHPFWLHSIKTMHSYERLHDDHDGTKQGVLNVMFSPDGDARVWITGERNEALRFRTFQGGGMSLRTRAALLILAEAIRLDNEKRPV